MTQQARRLREATRRFEKGSGRARSGRACAARRGGIGRMAGDVFEARRGYWAAAWRDWPVSGRRRRGAPGNPKAETSLRSGAADKWPQAAGAAMSRFAVVVSVRPTASRSQCRGSFCFGTRSRLRRRTPAFLSPPSVTHRRCLGPAREPGTGPGLRCPPGPESARGQACQGGQAARGFGLSAESLAVCWGPGLLGVWLSVGGRACRGSGGWESGCLLGAGPAIGAVVPSRTGSLLTRQPSDSHVDVSVFLLQARPARVGCWLPWTAVVRPEQNHLGIHIKLL